jgi:hypothetical protein
MQVIITYPNTKEDRLKAEYAVVALDDEYGEFDNYRTVAGNNNQLHTILQSDYALLNQYDVQYIVGDDIKVQVVD